MFESIKKKIANGFCLTFVKRYTSWDGKTEAACLVKKLTDAAVDGKITNEERVLLQREAYSWLDRNGFMNQ